MVGRKDLKLALEREMKREANGMKFLAGAQYLRDEFFRKTKLYMSKNDWEITGWVGKKICRKGMLVDPKSKQNMEVYTEMNYGPRYQKIYMTKRNNDIYHVRMVLKKRK